MNRNIVEIVPLKGNYHLLPETSYFRKYCEENEENPESLIVLVKGNFEPDNICLDSDEIGKLFVVRAGNPVVLMVIGNLETKGNIWNANTDAATILYVNGNISAQNMTVGGQEIIIGGNLRLSGIFWGDYNRGACMVGADLTAEALLLTEKYDFSVAGDVECPYFVSGSYDDCYVEEFLLEYFCPQDLDYNTEDECILILPEHRAGVLKNFNTNSSYRKEMRDQASLVFPNKRPSYDNMRRLTSSLLTQNPDREYRFAKDGINFNVSRDWESDYGFEYSNVEMKSEDFKFYLNAYLREDGLFDNAVKKFTSGAMKWLSGKGKKQAEKRLTIHYQNPAKDEIDFIELDENTDEFWHDAFRRAWEVLLTNMPLYELCRERLFSVISIPMIKTLLDLPVAYAYPYFDEDNSFWIGNLGMTFRHEGDKCSAGIARCARVGFLVELPRENDGNDGEDNADFAQYIFDIEDYGTENERLVFRYFTNSMYDNDENPREVECHETYHAREAIRLLKRFHYFIDKNLYPDIFGTWQDCELISPPENDCYLPDDRAKLLEKNYARLRKVIAGRCLTMKRKAWLCFAFSPHHDDAWMNFYYQIESGHILSVHFDDELSRRLFGAVKDISSIEHKRKNPWLTRIFCLSDGDIGYSEWDAGYIADFESFAAESSKWENVTFAGFDIMRESAVSNLDEINHAVNNNRQHLYVEGTDTLNSSEEGFITINKEAVPGNVVHVTIECSENKFSLGLPEYERYYRWLVENESKARQFLVNELYGVFKENWEEGDDVSEENFYERIYLSGALINLNEMTIYYYDDDLFGGQWITACLDDNNKLKNASIGI